MTTLMNFYCDENLIAESESELNDSVWYYINCLGYILKLLRGDPKLERSYLFQEAIALTWYFSAPKTQPRPKIKNITERLHFMGTLGKALFFINGVPEGQLRKELLRFDNSGDRVGTWYMLHLAGELASAGYSIQFVPERNNKTPDFSASKNGKILYVEANAKQPKMPVDNPQKMQRLIQAIIEEKRQKFIDPKFWPGVIVADISPAHFLVNEHGLQPVFQLLEALVEPDRKSLLVQSQGPHGPTYIPNGFQYPIYKDRGFFSRKYNNGNFLHYLALEFSKIDLSETQIIQCVLSITRHAQRVGGSVSFLKGHQVLMRKGYENLAFSEVCPHRYIV